MKDLAPIYQKLEAALIEAMNFGLEQRIKEDRVQEHVVMSYEEQQAMARGIMMHFHLTARKKQVDLSLGAMR